MSLWTHVVGAIHANFYGNSTSEAWENAITILKDAPKVTGSEGDMQTFVHPLDGYNNAEYDTNVERKWQTGMVVSLVGDLRDRTVEAVCKEMKPFLDYVKNSTCYMENLSVNIEDSCGAQAMYCNPYDLGIESDWLLGAED